MLETLNIVNVLKYYIKDRLQEIFQAEKIHEISQHVARHPKFTQKVAITISRSVRYRCVAVVESAANFIKLKSFRANADRDNRWKRCLVRNHDDRRRSPSAACKYQSTHSGNICSRHWKPAGPAVAFDPPSRRHHPLDRCAGPASAKCYHHFRSGTRRLAWLRCHSDTVRACDVGV